MSAALIRVVTKKKDFMRFNNNYYCYLVSDDIALVV